MIGTIRRGKSQPWGTPGKLVSNAGFMCDTLELPWRNNLRGVSCIVAPDSYIGYPWESPTLGRTVIRLIDKNGRKDCLLHNGTWAGDTGLDIDGDGKAGDLVTQVHGCTLVGRGFGMIQRPDGAMQMGIYKSKDTLAELIKHFGPGQHSFLYLWDPGCEP